MCFFVPFSNKVAKVVKNLDICKLYCDFIKKDRFYLSYYFDYLGVTVVLYNLYVCAGVYIIE